jgi:hypothetical protein
MKGIIGTQVWTVTQITLKSYFHIVLQLVLPTAKVYLQKQTPQESFLAIYY